VSSVQPVPIRTMNGEVADLGQHVRDGHDTATRFEKSHAPCCKKLDFIAVK
jgi:hypothetical protein